ncbi:MAG: SpoVA/SpoVAEb family sporulation membrane protein [Lachnospiraceae bacterium]|nr:SpoVA/SpoVAEb family sporulation membrane protein [Lachnospiraceae bacterium]
MEALMDKQQYQEYIKQVTPTHNVWLNMFHAFWMGGLVCTLGQFITNTLINTGMDKETAGKWNLLALIALSVILTGFNIFAKLAKLGGAGVLVPITGFANGIASAAIEYKKEGQVFGIGCKIFTIAGPVILYGILTSWVLGLGYWILQRAGVLA